MEFVNGIGGVFLFSDQPAKLAQWYKENLGLDFEGGEDCGSFYKNFTYRDENDGTKELMTTWSIMRGKVSLANAPRTGQINYRVVDLARLLTHLTGKGITIEKSEEYSYGKFAWINDPDGNSVELYEPIDH
jgi:catechol 2,3-dioxygenase-like lactoylglutathione lyase family enzyme